MSAARRKLRAPRADRIDAAARRAEKKPVRARMRLPAQTIRRLLLVAGVYVVGFFVLTHLVRALSSGSRDSTGTLVLSVVLLAFVFETVDSAAGMGFGTALAPLLFVLGYSPLQVVPALLAAEAMTGLLAGFLHHEFRNIELSWRPLNEAARTLILIAAFGSAGAIAAATVAYFALPVPEQAVKTYVAIVVLLMGVFMLLRHALAPRQRYRPRRLLFFAALAGVNKGLGGGGYGPVLVLGSAFAGIIEKSATAIAALAEGVVSLLGLLTVLAIGAAGTGVDLTLLPSLWLGAFPAAVIAPYAVRVVPNIVWRYVVPIYAVAIAGVTLFQLYLMD